MTIQLGDKFKNKFNGKIYRVTEIKDFAGRIGNPSLFKLDNGQWLQSDKLNNWLKLPRPTPQVLKAEVKLIDEDKVEKYICSTCGKEYVSYFYYKKHIAKCEE